MPKTKIDRFLLIATILIIFAAMYVIIFPALKKIHQERNRIASQEIKDKMAYHGTGMCWEERGVNYFINKRGQKCKL